MTDLGTAGRRLLAGKPGHVDSSKEVSERAARALDRLAHHMARLLGEMGMQMLVGRSVAIASVEFPWLRTATASTAQPASIIPALSEAMEQQEPESITDAFVAILSTLVDLLNRLIGQGLVERLLNEVWPTVFVHEAKDTP